ncbi:MAG: metallophosphoesterase [Candidatus Borkfalkiaceae bacterium]|nr:metallophosphoesterase [Christensenellaceae bacterium]
MRKFVCAFVAAAFLLSAISCGEQADTEKRPSLEETVDFVLEVEGGRDVRILQLTDIQIIDSDQQRYEGRLHPWSIEPWKPEHMEELSFAYMRKTVEQADPDLIVLSGDNVYGEFDDNGTSLRALVAELDGYRIPWTFTFGNHDNETRLGVEATVAEYLKSEYCLFKRGPEPEVVDGESFYPVAGNGNFNIGIVQDGRLTEVVWLMDSNGHTDSDKTQNMYSTAGLMDSQIEWFRERNELLRRYGGGVSPKSIGFFHHPMRAYGDAMQKYGYISSRHDFYDENGDYGNFKPVRIPENDEGDSGNMNVDAGQYIDGAYVFHNLLKTYGCEGWFFGHDHENNASAVFEGVRYTYGLKASKYDSFTEGEIGGTLIKVGQNGLSVSRIFAVD